VLKPYIWFESPPRKTCDINLSEVQSFLYGRCKSASIASIHLQGINYFFALFEFPEGSHSILDIFKALYKGGFIRQVMELDILDLSIYWSRKILEGFGKLVDCVMLLSEDADDQIAYKCGELIAKRFVQPLTAKTSSFKAEQLERRERIDKLRMTKLPPLETMRSSAVQAMMDIDTLYKRYIDSYMQGEDIPAIARRALNAKGIGALSFTTYPGRPGEWEDMRVGLVQACVDDPSCWFIIIALHKTWKTHGKLGRYIPEEVKPMLRQLVAFSRSPRHRLYQNLSAESKPIQISKAAKDFALVHTPSYEYPEPTLMRKFVETSIGDPANRDKATRMAAWIKDGEGVEKSLNAAASFAGHHRKTGDLHYNLNSANPGEHAQASKAFVAEFMGGPLQSPTDDQIEAQKERTAEVILDEFKRLVAKSSHADICEHSEEDEEEGLGCEAPSDNENDEDENAVRPDEHPTYSRGVCGPSQLSQDQCLIAAPTPPAYDTEAPSTPRVHKSESTSPLSSSTGVASRKSKRLHAMTESAKRRKLAAEQFSVSSHCGQGILALSSGVGDGMEINESNTIEESPIFEQTLRDMCIVGDVVPIGFDGSLQLVSDDVQAAPASEDPKHMVSMVQATKRKSKSGHTRLPDITKAQVECIIRCHANVHGTGSVAGKSKAELHKWASIRNLGVGEGIIEPSRPLDSLRTIVRKAFGQLDVGPVVSH
jgi:hypothetical protein